MIQNLHGVCCLLHCNNHGVQEVRALPERLGYKMMLQDPVIILLPHSSPLPLSRSLSLPLSLPLPLSLSLSLSLSFSLFLSLSLSLSLSLALAVAFALAACNVDAAACRNCAE